MKIQAILVNRASASINTVIMGTKVLPKDIESFQDAIKQLCLKRLLKDADARDWWDT